MRFVPIMSNKKLVFNFNNVSDYYIDTFVKDFIITNLDSINELAYSLYKDDSDVAFSAFQEIIQIELKKACYSFANNSDNNPNEIEKYLFACVHKSIRYLKEEGKKTVYICPACKYNSGFQILKSYPKKVVCNICQNILNSTTSKWEDFLYKTFAEHSRKGYRCNDCDKFIPENKLLAPSDQIICPYPDCVFVGKVSELKIMRHPFIKTTLEAATLKEEMLADENFNTDTGILVKENVEEYLSVLNECINSQIAIVKYNSNESTIVSKLSMYEAYKNIISKFPEEMISYLINLNSNMKIQHIIFQEFVSVLESKIPFSYKTNGKIVEIKSIMDDNLCIFNGITSFNAVVDEKREIPNLTEELYVGGRKGTYCKPYYIGKILDVIDIDKNISILSSLDKYNFFRLFMKNNINPGTNVKIIHAKIPPHYSMGSMVYLNRARRAIVDKAYFMLNGIKRKHK